MLYVFAEDEEGIRQNFESNVWDEVLDKAEAAVIDSMDKTPITLDVAWEC